MITVTLDDKKYSVAMITGRALRGAHVVEAFIEEVSGDNLPAQEKMDAVCAWFCDLFNNQFSVSELYDFYPVDSLFANIITTYYAVISGATARLSDFPIKPVTMETVAP